jgi:hypothetical protein
MAAQIYQPFRGYWTDQHGAGLPTASGIYAVYACVRAPWANTVSLRGLLYVGEAENVSDRVSCHERWIDWQLELRDGESLCYGAALISPSGARRRAEAAIINRHKPVCNIECVNSFPHDKTTVFIGGANALMTPFFTVSGSTPDTLADLLAAIVRK